MYTTEMSKDHVFTYFKKFIVHVHECMLRTEVNLRDCSSGSWLFKNCVCLLLLGEVGYATVHMWCQRTTFVKPVLSFPLYAGSRDQT